jgi:hypothetical protein
MHNKPKLNTIRGMRRKSMRKPTSVVAFSLPLETHTWVIWARTKRLLSRANSFNPCQNNGSDMHSARAHQITSSTFTGYIYIFVCEREAFGGAKGNTIGAAKSLCVRSEFGASSGSKRRRFVPGGLSGREHACGAAKFGQRHFTCGGGGVGSGVLAPLAQRQK